MYRWLSLARGPLVAWSVGLALVSGVQAQGVTDTSIVLGQNLTLQGGKNGYGVAAAQGMKLYIDQANAAGGVGGRSPGHTDTPAPRGRNASEAGGR